MEGVDEVRSGGRQMWNDVSGFGGSSGQLREWKRREMRKSAWADDEHERFVAALKRYGRDWKAIESSVGTRTAVQIRSHAQKYFIKLRRHNISEFDALPPPRKKRSREKDPSFSYEDDVRSPSPKLPYNNNIFPGSPEQPKHEPTLTARDYACVDALTLLVCAADRINA
uniref:Uncharacterized protein n=1 Tax=Rhodosorus marinus TaxID=101924 RepID=A0A7S2ZWG9_9RHOD|mmetsp:Transcript_33673/g.132589  ORF Transcript_33673/g.132589 Transcript_33673/m.132589 type:complete len:169 (+) Transcript_33673:147-653(+)